MTNMKSRLLNAYSCLWRPFVIAVSVFFVVNVAAAQSFPDYTAAPEWIFGSACAYDNPQFGTDILRSLRDTLIDGVHWNVLTQHGTTAWYDELGLEGHVRGFYRVEGKKVYARKAGPDTNPEAGDVGLLYDFSLMPGDSVYCLSPRGFDDSTLYRVLSIDSFYCEVFDAYLRVLDVVGEYQEPFGGSVEFPPTQWIEGMGDRKTPFPPFSCVGLWCIEFEYIGFAGFSTDTYEIASTVPTPACMPVVAVDEAGSLAQSLRGFPNPTADALHFYGAEPVEVSVFDSLGRLLGRYEPQRGQIDVSFLPEGLYLVSARMPNGELVVGKFVVER